MTSITRNESGYLKSCFLRSGASDSPKSVRFGKEEVFEIEHKDEIAELVRQEQQAQAEALMSMTSQLSLEAKKRLFKLLCEKIQEREIEEN